jgi:hypothetical protein
MANASSTPSSMGPMRAEGESSSALVTSWDVSAARLTDNAAATQARMQPFGLQDNA